VSGEYRLYTFPLLVKKKYTGHDIRIAWQQQISRQ